MCCILILIAICLAQAARWMGCGVWVWVCKVRVRLYGIVNVSIPNSENVLFSRYSFRIEKFIWGFPYYSGSIVISGVFLYQQYYKNKMFQCLQLLYLSESYFVYIVKIILTIIFSLIFPYFFLYSQPDPFNVFCRAVSL